MGEAFPAERYPSDEADPEAQQEQHRQPQEGQPIIPPRIPPEEDQILADSWFDDQTEGF